MGIDGRHCRRRSGGIIRLSIPRSWPLQCRIVIQRRSWTDATSAWSLPPTHPQPCHLDLALAAVIATWSGHRAPHPGVGCRIIQSPSIWPSALSRSLDAIMGIDGRHLRRRAASSAIDLGLVTCRVGPGHGVHRTWTSCDGRHIASASGHRHHPRALSLLRSRHPPWSGSADLCPSRGPSSNIRPPHRSGAAANSDPLSRCWRHPTWSPSVGAAPTHRALITSAASVNLQLGPTGPLRQLTLLPFQQMRRLAPHCPKQLPPTRRKH